MSRGTAMSIKQSGNRAGTERATSPFTHDRFDLRPVQNGFRTASGADGDVGFDHRAETFVETHRAPAEFGRQRLGPLQGAVGDQHRARPFLGQMPHGVCPLMHVGR